MALTPSEHDQADALVNTLIEHLQQRGDIRGTENVLTGITAWHRTEVEHALVVALERLIANAPDLCAGARPRA
jgi:hypothetical protein